MFHSNEISSVFISVSQSLSPHTRKMIKARLLRENPELANNPPELKRQLLKKTFKMRYVDSSYYLG